MSSSQGQTVSGPATVSHTPSWLDSWHVNPSLNRDYDFIDGLRGLAIVMVLACHHIYVNPQSGPLTRLIGAFFGAGAGGVVIFFALSGFLIAWPFWKQKFAASEAVVPRRYAQRRFWKIYPPLVLSLIILTPIDIYMHRDWSSISIAATWFTGLPFLVPIAGRINPVMWTLVIEVQFYITLPLIFLLLKKVPARTCLWLIPLIFLVVPATFRAVTGLGPTNAPEINSHYPSALDAFCLGIFMAGLDNKGRLPAKWAVLGVLGLLMWPVIMFLIGWVETHPQVQGSLLDQSLPWLEKIASGCLLCFVANPKQAVARLLCAPWLRWCGIVSYEWYLLHQPIVACVRLAAGSSGGRVLIYGLILGGSLVLSGVLSALVYRFYSLPILKYGRSHKLSDVLSALVKRFYSLPISKYVRGRKD